MQRAANPAESEALQKRKEALVETLRSRFAGMDRAALRAIPTIRAYEDHYKRFDKTYHVRLQLESILFGHKPISAGPALVEAMFVAEVDSMLLTAAHDLDFVRLPLVVDAASGNESYTLMRGIAQAPKAGDMMISDQDGILSSIIYGPDSRTRLRAETTNAVFTVYGPAGISAEAIGAHLDQIGQNIKLFAPGARIALSGILPAR